MNEKMMNLQSEIMEKQEELRVLEEQYEREEQRQSKVTRLFDKDRLSQRAVSFTSSDIGDIAAATMFGQLADFLGECFEQPVAVPEQVKGMKLSYALIALQESGAGLKKKL